jgi:hypothetical protein
LLGVAGVDGESESPELRGVWVSVSTQELHECGRTYLAVGRLVGWAESDSCGGSIATLCPPTVIF